MEKILTFFKGLVIGTTMLVPGVSGGSMAMVIGIYNKLVTSVSSFKNDIRNNTLFLCTFVFGAGIGIVLFAKPLLNLIEAYPKPMMFTILGFVAGGIPPIYKQAKVSKLGLLQSIYIIIGLISVLIFNTLPTNNNLEISNNIIYLLISGFIAAIALILPGISVSYLLLLMGLYNKTMLAISHMEFSFLIPMALGVFIGIILCTKVLEKAMSNHPQPTYLTIIGFVLGSMICAFPGRPVGIQWLICIPALVIGFIVMLKINHQTN